MKHEQMDTVCMTADREDVINHSEFCEAASGCMMTNTQSVKNSSKPLETVPLSRLDFFCPPAGRGDLRGKQARAASRGLKPRRRDAMRCCMQS